MSLMGFFWVEPEKDYFKSYDDLLQDIQSKRFVDKYIKNNNNYNFFLDLICSMLTDRQFALIDKDWSQAELNNLGLNEIDLTENVKLESNDFFSIDEVLNRISQYKEWKLGFYTSGTTGRPKFISHNLGVLSRNVKTGSRFQKNIWGFCYNPTHFAGIQVFLQAFFNQNSIINLFNMDYSIVERTIKKYAISHLSATPTYYRSLYPFLHESCPLVERITFGGEIFDDQIAQMLINYFPNAKITNVYASTELGSVLAGEGNTLKIPEEFKDRIKISEDGELVVHRSLMGEDTSLDNDLWFSTGDIVTNEPDGTIKFISRKTEMINVGGYKINPHEIEGIINEIHEIQDSIVYGRDNRITGKVLVAEVVLRPGYTGDMERKIFEYLSGHLQPWKIPRMIKITDSIDRTRTGKKVRK
ncbi:ANL family adenylate-forming protein [Methanospirillum stamsii]|uniref:AMP-binding protein n=1 Tax=Methanospirillum stamsii TaxID=1277351 RepID=A0A2V2MN00_9EURY|nr:fatty acid--CoA ligase family protein [Methanospirillum stamsii]PWR69624.1 hypothetical protein DLD82_17275 [Methanospirillum stamsii]